MEHDPIQATLTGDGYPSDMTLEQIAHWPITNLSTDLHSLLAFVRSIWRYAEDGFWIQDPALVGCPTIDYHISTGGWSGNESIIGAMRDNPMFWRLAWYQSQRGGHFIFKIPNK